MWEKSALKMRYLGHDRTTICEKNANFDDRSTIV